MMSRYVNTIPGQIRYPSLQIFEIQFICHNGQNLPPRAQMVCVVIKFGQTFHQRGANSTFLKLLFYQWRQHSFSFPRNNIIQACINNLSYLSSIKPFCQLGSFCSWCFLGMANWTYIFWNQEFVQLLPWRYIFFFGERWFIEITF